MQNRVEEARLVLLKTNDNDREVEERLKPVWREMLSPSPVLCQMLVVGFGIQCFQQITRIDATVYYNPEIFQGAGIKEMGL